MFLLRTTDEQNLPVKDRIIKIITIFDIFFGDDILFLGIKSNKTRCHTFLTEGTKCASVLQVISCKSKTLKFYGFDLNDIVDVLV